MAKNKNKTPKPNQSFDKLVAKHAVTQSIDQLTPFIQSMVDRHLNQFVMEQQVTLRAIFTRLVTIEKLLFEHTSITPDQFSKMFAITEDNAIGYNYVERPIQEGDRVRSSLASRELDQPGYSEATPHIFDNVGSGSSNKELEDALIGLSAGDEVELEVGEGETKLGVKVTVDMVAEPQTPKEDQEA